MHHRWGWVLIAAFALQSLTGTEARISNWRAEFVKCSYLNYELNSSRTVQFCGQTPQFFCCFRENIEATNKCCTLDEFLDELRLQFFSVHFLSWLILLLMAVVAVSSLYIRLKTKRLLRHVYPMK